MNYPLLANLKGPLHIEPLVIGYLSTVVLKYDAWKGTVTVQVTKTVFKLLCENFIRLLLYNSNKT